MTGIFVASVVMAGVAFGGLIHLVRTERIPRRGVQVLATACGFALLAMVVTDWPTNSLNLFWAEHSVLAGVGSTLFMVGIGYLVWEWGEQIEQDRLAVGLSGAGLGGIVDHVVDAEVALAMVSADAPPPYPAWDAPDRPLKWLRAIRPVLERDHVTGRARPSDPRSRPVYLPAADPTWRIHIVDQVIRRLLAAMRDWAPLIDRSKDGTTALLMLSELRKDLMELSFHLQHGHRDPAEKLLLTLRQRLRILAYFFEDLSRNSTQVTADGADTPFRPEVLLTLWPLPAITTPLQWEADLESIPAFSRTRQKRLEQAISQVSGHALSPMSVQDARELARTAHTGQVNKQGADYLRAHLEPIAARLTKHGEPAIIAGWLHDILEDTETTVEELLAAGASPAVVHAIEAVSKREGEPYDELILRAKADPLGRVVKLADNAQNLADNPSLEVTDPENAARLHTKYEAARQVLLGEGS